MEASPRIPNFPSNWATETSLAFDKRTTHALELLEQESNPRLYYQGLLYLGTRLKQAGDWEQAAVILGRLVGPQATEQTEIPAEIRDRAKHEYEAITGQGDSLMRWEALLSKLPHEALNPKAILPMVGASVLGHLAGTSLLGRLANSSSAGLWTRGFGARLASGVFALAIEAPAFAGLNRAIQGANGTWGEELGRSFLSLGLLKGFHYAGHWGFLQSQGFAEFALPAQLSRNARMLQQVMPHLSGYAGLIAAHYIEEQCGLRAAVAGATLFTDAANSLVQLTIGGKVGHTLLGRRFLEYQKQVTLKAEADIRGHERWLSSPGQLQLALTPLVLMGMVGMPGDVRSGRKGVFERSRHFLEKLAERDHAHLPALKTLEATKGKNFEALFAKQAATEARTVLSLTHLSEAGFDWALNALAEAGGTGFYAAHALEGLVQRGHPEGLAALSRAAQRGAQAFEFLWARSAGGNKQAKILLQALPVEFWAEAAPHQPEAIEKLTRLGQLKNLDAIEALKALAPNSPEAILGLEPLVVRRVGDTAKFFQNLETTAIAAQIGRNTKALRALGTLGYFENAQAQSALVVLAKTSLGPFYLLAELAMKNRSWAVLGLREAAKSNSLAPQALAELSAAGHPLAKQILASGKLHAVGLPAFWAAAMLNPETFSTETVTALVAITLGAAAMAFRRSASDPPYRIDARKFQLSKAHYQKARGKRQVFSDHSMAPQGRLYALRHYNYFLTQMDPEHPEFRSGLKALVSVVHDAGVTSVDTPRWLESVDPKDIAGIYQTDLNLRSAALEAVLQLLEQNPAEHQAAGDLRAALWAGLVKPSFHRFSVEKFLIGLSSQKDRLADEQYSAIGASVEGHEYQLRLFYLRSAHRLHQLREPWAAEQEAGRKALQATEVLALVQESAEFRTLHDEVLHAHQVKKLEGGGGSDGTGSMMALGLGLSGEFGSILSDPWLQGGLAAAGILAAGYGAYRGYRWWQGMRDKVYARLLWGPRPGSVRELLSSQEELPPPQKIPSPEPAPAPQFLAPSLPEQWIQQNRALMARTVESFQQGLSSKLLDQVLLQEWAITLSTCHLTSLQKKEGLCLLWDLAHLEKGIEPEAKEWAYYDYLTLLRDTEYVEFGSAEAQREAMRLRHVFANPSAPIQKRLHAVEGYNALIGRMDPTSPLSQGEVKQALPHLDKLWAEVDGKYPPRDYYFLRDAVRRAFEFLMKEGVEP